MKIIASAAVKTAGVVGNRQAGDWSVVILFSSKNLNIFDMCLICLLDFNMVESERATQAWSGTEAHGR